jgi:hypothetical protein
MIRLWVQFNYQNIHNFNFWPNLAILKHRIYSKLQNTQSLGYKFGKKFQLRRWCKFLLENHEKSRFCHTRCVWMQPYILSAKVFLQYHFLLTIVYWLNHSNLSTNMNTPTTDTSAPRFSDEQEFDVEKL